METRVQSVKLFENGKTIRSTSPAPSVDVADSSEVELQAIAIEKVDDLQSLRRSVKIKCAGLCNGDVAFCIAAKLCESE